MSDWSSPFCLYTKSRQSLYTRSAIRLRDEYDASSAQVADARLFFVVLQSQDVVVPVAGDVHQMPLLNSGSGPDMRRLECVLRTRRTWRVITQAQSQLQVALELGWLLCVPSTLCSSVCVCGCVTFTPQFAEACPTVTGRAWHNFKSRRLKALTWAFCCVGRIYIQKQKNYDKITIKLINYKQQSGRENLLH